MASPRSMAAPAAVLLLFLLLVGTEMGALKKTAEARTCQSQSHKFKGACFSDSNCASVCRTEHFPDGECNTHYVERKCYCKRDC